MTMNDTNDAEALALRALVWILGDDSRASRFLAITGLTPERLRAGIEDRPTLEAAFAFLEAHEPDLVACAAMLEVAPQSFAAARHRLDR
jgi:hypothetical protein